MSQKEHHEIETTEHEESQQKEEKDSITANYDNIANNISVDDVQVQLSDIRREVEIYPPLSESFPLNEHSTLAEEFANDPVVSSQIRSLFMSTPSHTTSNASSRTYSAIRYARRDGNCFYRCAAFQLLNLARIYSKFAERTRKLVLSLRDKLIRQFGEYSSDFADAMSDVLVNIQADAYNSANDLQNYVCCADFAYIIVFLRYAVSLYLREHSEEFLPYVLGLNFTSVEDYCANEVEPVDHESDNIQLVAFAALFRVIINVVVLDRTAKPTPSIYTFGESNDSSNTDTSDNNDNNKDYKDNEEDEDDENQYQIHLLFRPGHYDLL